MQIKAIGILSVNSGNTTMVVCLGDSPQLYPIPTDIRDIAIDPVLLDKGVKIDGAGNLSIPGKSVIMLNLSPRFSRVEVVVPTAADAQLFMQTVQSDPDVVAFAKQVAGVAKIYIDAAIDNITKVLDLLPDNGPTAILVGQLEKANWTEAVVEIGKATKIAHPDLWASLEKSMSPDTLAWLTGKMK